MSERISAQTRTVMDLLASERCHLTAEEILDRIPGASAATVYRSLERLTETGRVHKLNLGSRRAVYEYARQPHMHLVCRICGRICDISVDLTGVAREAARCYGYVVEQSSTTAWGVCSECAAQNKNPDETNKQASV